ncbi:MAG: hypothetical protein R3B47_00145 [Bacteroidia bacterium]
MKVFQILCLLVALATLSCSAQKSIIPSTFSNNVKQDNKGALYLELGDEKYPVAAPTGIGKDQAMPRIEAAAEGLRFSFGENSPVLGIYYGFLPYDDSGHPMPVYRNFSLIDSKGNLDLNINKLQGKYDMIGWVEKGVGTVGYRVVGREAQLLYDGVISFTGKPDGPFEVANTVIEGPTVNQLGPESCVIAFRTNKAVATRIEVSRPGTRALTKTFSEKEATTDHEILLDGLNSDVEYAYTLLYGGKNDMQERKFQQSYAFKTAPKPGSRKPFVFAYASDSRSGYGGGERDFAGSNAYIMKKIMALASSHEVAFFQFSGDLINGYSNNDQHMKLEYASWKRAVQPFAHYFPIYVSMGNHEAYVYQFDTGGPYGLQIPHFPETAEDLFNAEFCLPENGPESEDGAWYDPDPGKVDFPKLYENVYHHTYDNVAVIVLNSTTRTCLPQRPLKVGGGMHVPISWISNWPG